VLKHALPLLRGGAAVAVYSPTVEPLVSLADRFSVARRGLWLKAQKDDEARTDERRTAAILDEAIEDSDGHNADGAGEEDEINPLLLIGPTIQTSRARQWQVLPGRTHPVMTARGGAEGYIFTGWRAVPVQGMVEARGKHKRRKVD
jgi:tRNA (adenine58-N1)-methyltransferase non-catalytic subunit